MKHSNASGFTLIELIIYTGLASLVIIIATTTLGTLRESQARSQSIAEVDLQGALVTDFIVQTLRVTESVTAPTAGNSGGTLTLDVVTTGADPVEFSSAGGAITLSVAGGSDTSITNNLVEVSGLTFEHSAPAGTNGAIKFSFTLSRLNDSGLGQYNYSRTFYGSGTLRQ